VRIRIRKGYFLADRASMRSWIVEKIEMMSSENTELLMRMQSGDFEGCTRVLQAWEPIARRAIRRIIHNSFDENDVLQEVLVSAMMKMPQLNDMSRSAQWVSLIARNAAISFIRDPPVQRLLEEPPATKETHDLYRGKMRLLVRQAVAGLSIARRNVINLHYYRGLSYLETAELLGLSAITVRSRLQKARGKITEVIGSMATPNPEHYALTKKDINALRSLADFTIAEEKWPAFQGILFDVGGWAVATDGRRLARRHIEGMRNLSVPVVLGPWRGTEAILSERALEIELDGQSAFLRSTGTEGEELQIMDVQYPKYESVLPTEAPLCSISIPALSLRRALQSILLQGDQQPQPTIVEISKDLLTLKRRWRNPSSEVEARISVLESACNSGLFRFCAEARYLHSALPALDPEDDDLVRLCFYGQTRAVIFLLPKRDREIVLVMPLDPEIAA
jgi:RNA polymerase sigma-70 factor, ECF subfamily